MSGNGAAREEREMAEIRLDGVTKRYPDGTEGVKDLDLDIGDGEFMILVGPSGCGKSTALRMVAGLEEITQGELTIGGRRVNDVAPKDRDIAMVFQNYALYPHMTVRENMGYALKKRKVPREEINTKVEDGQDPRPHRAPRPQARQHVRRPAPAGGHGARDRP
jgi:multiple sugar transport system ATP-binding protein